MYFIFSQSILYKELSEPHSTMLNKQDSEQQYFKCLVTHQKYLQSLKNYAQAPLSTLWGKPWVPVIPKFPPGCCPQSGLRVTLQNSQCTFLRCCILMFMQHFPTLVPTDSQQVSQHLRTTAHTRRFREANSCSHGHLVQAESQDSCSLVGNSLVHDCMFQGKKVFFKM